MVRRLKRPLRDGIVAEGRAIEAAVPQQLAAVGANIARLREMALVDFVTDPDQRTLAEHYARVDRPWRKHVENTTFYQWAAQGKWIDRRAQWWSQIEARILAKRAEQVANQRISEIETLESVRENMSRYLFPLLSKEGVIQLHPEMGPAGQPNPLAGLPVYGLKMPSLDKFVSSFIALDKQIMLKRGEIRDRDPESGASFSALPPVTAHESGETGVSGLAPEDLRAMAHALVRRRQPELADQPEITIESRVQQDTSDD